MLGNNKLMCSIVGLMLMTFASNSALVAQLSKPNSDLKMSARYHIETGKDTGFLIVKMEIPKGNHIYSLTQGKPLSPSKLTVKPTKQVVAAKSFTADRKPKVIEHDPVFETRIEKHAGTVQFFVPIRVDTSANLKRVSPQVTFSGQMCSDQGFCKLINNKTIAAKFAGYYSDREAKQLPKTSRK